MNKIEWCDLTINPIIGCSKISDGCRNCYAEKMAWRHAHNPKLSTEVRKAYKSVVKNGKWNGKTVYVPSMFDEWENGRNALYKKIKVKNSMVFIGSMCDVFYATECCGDYILAKVLSDIKDFDHTYLFLTKRSNEMRRFFLRSPQYLQKNFWIGVTVESQKYIDRVDDLIRIPAKVRFISVEPMLSEITISPEKLRQLQWVICGGETGPGARPMNIEWVHCLKKQCDDAGVPFFFKKWGNRTSASDGYVWGKFCREFPNG